MEKHDSFRSWWAGVPNREKPGLRMLGIVFVVVFAMFVVLTCFLGAFVVAPLGIIALERFYADQRNAIVAAAEAAGVPRLIESH